MPEQSVTQMLCRVGNRFMYLVHTSWEVFGYSTRCNTRIRGQTGQRPAVATKEAVKDGASSYETLASKITDTN
jgi:hypothetical protein